MIKVFWPKRDVFITLTFVLSILFCHKNAVCATWTDPGNYDTSWYNDLSTSFDIYTPEQFAGFVFLSNSNTSFEGKTLNIRADLDMQKHDWTSCKELSGEINGNGFECKNIHYNYTIPRYNSTSDHGLFGCISQTGIIRDIKFSNINFVYSRNTLSDNMHDVNIGVITAKNEGLINNLSLDIHLSGQFIYSSVHGTMNIYVGGVSSMNSGNIYNCEIKGDIDCSLIYSNMGCLYLGGISGRNEGFIVNCLNHCNLTANYKYDTSRSNFSACYCGGICGISSKAISNIISCGNVQILADIISDSGINGNFSKADGVCAINNGDCKNAYFSSQAEISGASIPKNGTMLSIEQMRNQTLDFTSLLNYNVDLIDFSPKTYWANSPDFNNNEPFLINSLNIELQTANVTQSSISVVCQPLQMTSSWIIEKGFEYKKQGSHIIQTAIVNDNFSADLLDLEVDAVYEVRAFVKGKTGVVYSKNLNIKTSAPTIQTLDATEITPVSATLNGKIDVGNTPIKSQGFLWKEQDGEYNVILTQGSEYSVKIDHLKPSTTYIYQAYAIDELDKSIYGKEVNFKTLPVNVILDNIRTTPYSIELNGHINLNMATDIIVEYRESNIGAFAHQKVISQSDGQFSTTIDGLWADTEYEIRAYFVYNKSTVYSPQETISTLPLEITTLTPLVDKYVEFYASVVGKVQSGEFGFEYREINIPDIIPSKYIVCSINDNRLAGIPTELENDVKYKVRAYYKSLSNNYSYGQWIEFLPTDLATVDNIEIDNKEEVIAVYNVYGQRVNTFTKGINLVILSNGQTKKVIF